LVTQGIRWQLAQFKELYHANLDPVAWAGMTI
jgi:hypothetical protein